MRISYENFKIKLLEVIRKKNPQHLPLEEDVSLEGVDSLYHVQTNVSARMGITWGIKVHSIHKGEALFYLSVHISKGY